MAKELPYFKFYPSEWILGRISDQKKSVQGAFIGAICHYWHKKCDCFVSDFRKKIGKKDYVLLKTLNFFEEKNDKVIIPFLDEQFKELSNIHKDRVKAGLAGAEAKALAKQAAKPKQGEGEGEGEGEKEGEVDIEKEFLNSEAWVEQTAMHLKIKKPILKSSMHTFIAEQKLISDINKRTIVDVRKHFINLMKIKSPELTQNQTKGTGGISFA